MNKRPRRNRKSETIRSFARETSLNVSDLIYPLFLIEGKKQSIEVNSMPGIYRLSLDLLLKEIESSLSLGIKTFCMFPNINEKLKDSMATESLNENGLYLNALTEIKKRFPESTIMTDVAMDPYSSDGHDGIVKDGKILNDETLEVLGRMALAQAKCGADIIGPSDMMDGRIGYIRKILDENGYTDVSIMSYSAKYASAFYGPFRDALDSAPKFGDKKTYQMDPANIREAYVEAKLDEEEGADFLMVKPALSYLDVIKHLSDNFQLPIAAYNVSGEYAMVKAAGQKGWIDEKKIRNEILLSIKRAGAKIILTYFAKEFAIDQKIFCNCFFIFTSVREKKILLFFYFFGLLNFFQAQENTKGEYDSKQELIYDGKRYKVWNNYLTGGSMPGGSINSAIPTSQTAAALDFNFHIKKEYFQAGVLLSGNVFGDWNNSAIHFCWGKKIEKNKYLFAAYGGVDYSLFYPWQKDSVPARFTSPALNEIGAYAAIQNFWKIKYDVGGGCTIFASYNTRQYLVGVRLELFFSSAYSGEKGRRRYTD